MPYLASDGLRDIFDFISTLYIAFPGQSSEHLHTMGRSAIALLCLVLLATVVLATTKPDPSRVDTGAMKIVQADAKKSVQLQQDEDMPEHSDAYGKPDEKIF